MSKRSCGAFGSAECDRQSEHAVERYVLLEELFETSKRCTRLSFAHDHPSCLAARSFMISSAPPPICDHLYLAVDPLGARAADEPGAAQRLHRFVGAEAHRARREVLRHRELRVPARLARCLRELPGGVVDERAGGVQPRLHLHQLMPRSPGARRVACRTSCAPAPTECLVHAGLRVADCGGGHPEPLGVEVAHDDAEPRVLLADQVLCRHAARRRTAASPCPSTTSPSSSAGYAGNRGGCAPQGAARRRPRPARRCAPRPCSNRRARPR